MFYAPLTDAVRSGRAWQGNKILKRHYVFLSYGMHLSVYNCEYQETPGRSAGQKLQQQLEAAAGTRVEVCTCSHPPGTRTAHSKPRRALSILLFHVLCGHFLTYTTKESKRKNIASEINQLSDRRRRGRGRGWWEVFLNKESRRV